MKGPVGISGLCLALNLGWSLRAQRWAGLGRVDRQLPSTLQYPVRPASMTYDDIPHLSAKIKPKQQKVGCPLMEVEEGRGAMGGG